MVSNRHPGTSSLPDTELNQGRLPSLGSYQPTTLKH